ncbi:MAG: hypothetical protein IJW75_05825 [Alphaproteobacteria bacterium]|nr:hypothetical protein [Alphaproteobacteria bacterium]
MKNKLVAFFTVLGIFGISACKTPEVIPEPIPFDEGVNAEFVFPKDKRQIRTSDGANALDLETPLRCNVNWANQQMVLTLPFSNSAFRIERLEKTDKLPGFEVTGFTFETMSAEKALYQLTKEAGIKLVAKDAPYTSLSGENLKGEFSDIVNMITEAAEIFYSYDAKNKVMTLSRKTEIALYVPESRPIILSLLDVLRGAGITDLTTNWSDYTITLNVDMELKNKIVSLIDYFERNPNLIAYDVSIFKIYPKDNCDVEWKNLLDEFNFGSITTAQTGVIGRVLTTTNEISMESLIKFIEKTATIEPVSEGKFIVPDLWLSRFDVGKCGRMDTKESQLSLLAKASVTDNNRITSEVTLETNKGQITNFKIRNKLGENFMIIGIPSDVYLSEEKPSETVIFMVPRIIRTLKTTETIKNKI